MNLKNLISGPFLAYFPKFFGQKKFISNIRLYHAKFQTGVTMPQFSKN